MSYLFFASLTIAFLVVLVLVVFGIRVHRNNVWLLLFLMVLSYSVLIGHLMDQRLIYQFPHLIRTGTICGYLIVPSLYLYVRGTCYPGTTWRWWYALLFIPSLYFIVDFIPFWQLPAAEKINLFEISMRSQQSLHAFAEGWISPKGFHFVFRLIWSFFWFSAILSVIYKSRSVFTSPTAAHNRSVFRFIAGLMILCLPFMLAHLIINIFFYASYTLTNFTILLALPLVAAGIYLVFFPSVLYGLLPSAIGTVPPPEQVPHISVLQSKPDAVQEQQYNEELNSIYDAYKQQLLNYMVQEKPYLQKGLTIHQLAADSGIPSYILSMLINRHFGQTFNNWVNAYRIEAFKELIQSSDSKSYTMETLAKVAGFGSRVTLFNAFKKQTGITPSQYFRQQHGLTFPDNS